MTPLTAGVASTGPQHTVLVRLPAYSARKTCQRFRSRGQSRQLRVFKAAEAHVAAVFADLNYRYSIELWNNKRIPIIRELRS
jgi:hypothetical protein